MSRVRVFYGHEGVIPRPHGPAPVVTAPAAVSPEEGLAEQVPDETWTNKKIDAWSNATGIVIPAGKKADRVAYALEMLEAANSTEATDAGDSDTGEASTEATNDGDTGTTSDDAPEAATTDTDETAEAGSEDDGQSGEIEFEYE